MKVLDQNGSIIADADVRISIEGQEYRAAFDGKGAYKLIIPAKIRGDAISLVKAKGFNDLIGSFTIDGSSSAFEFILEPKSINAVVNITSTNRERRFDNAVSTILTTEEIESLPNDPRLIEKELRQRYGDDLRIEVDWQIGGQIPDKSRIASITIIQNVFDAQFHDMGSPVARIRTRAGGKSWSGSLSFSTSNSIFNARNSFDTQKIPTGRSRLGFTLNAPSIKNRFSLSFAANSFIKRNKVGFNGIADAIQDEALREDNETYLSYGTNLTFNLNAKNTLFGRIYDSTGTSKSLGLMDLQNRSIKSENRGLTVDLIETALFGNFTNELIAKIRKIQNDVVSVSTEPSLIVLGSFNDGGAGVKNKRYINSFQFDNLLSFNHGESVWKVGGGIDASNERAVIEDNINGTYIFSSSENFDSKLPALYTQRRKKAKVSVSDIRTNAFVQSYFNLTKFFQLALGARFEYSSLVSDKNNISPRLGFVWSPERSGRLIVRGGFGTTFNWLTSSDYIRVESFAFQNADELIIVDPQFPFNSTLTTSSGTNAQNTLKIDPKLRNPEQYMGFIRGELSLPRNLDINFHFISVVGNHLFRVRDLNAPRNGQRPNPEVGQNGLFESSDRGFSNLFNLRIRKSLHRIPLNFRYLFNRSRDEISGRFDYPSDNFNLRADWGAGNANRIHDFEFNALINLRNFTSRPLFREMTISINSTVQSGLPYNITTGYDDNGDTVLNDRPAGLARNSGRETWRRSTDVTISWNPKFGNDKSGKRLPSFGLSVNNLLNHNNKRGFIGVQTSSLYGKPSYAEEARNFEISVYYSF